MNIKIIINRFIIAFAWLLAVQFSASAQSADNLYKEFINLYNQGGDRTEAFTTLYECYEANKNALEKNPKNSPEYQQAKNHLLNIWPYLEAAVVFYANNDLDTYAAQMAEAYIGMPLLDDFRGLDFNYSSNRAKLAYYVGARYYSRNNYEKAIPFLNEYILTGEPQNRLNVYLSLIKSCTETNHNTQALRTLDNAIDEFKGNYDLLSTAINMCLDIKEYNALQKYLDMAKAVRPDDTTIENIQAKLYEDTRQYDLALAEYLSMLGKNPNSLEINKHVALNNYNLGVLYCNKAETETDKKQKKKLLEEAKLHFSNAIPYLEKVTGSEPMSRKYNMALATAYAQTGKSDQLAAINKKLSSMGAGNVSSDMIPKFISFSTDLAQQSQDFDDRAISTVPGLNYKEQPKFSDFARNIIENGVNKWQEKDPYETVDEYRKRVTDQNRNLKIAELRELAEKEYVSRYASDVTIDDMQLRPYDADHEVFLIESKFGQLILPVPRKGNQARLFEQNWNGIELRNPHFFIADDELAIADVVFVTPTGLSYNYSNTAAQNYAQANIDIKLNDIDYDQYVHNSNDKNKKIQIDKQQPAVVKSDVDVDIPRNTTDNSNTFALIIANENYSMVSPVASALNDGTLFSEYCNKILGLPQQNILLYKDASYGMMLAAMKQLSDIAQAFRNEDFNVIFYYAGHGIPDEKTKDGYLLPIDANGQQTKVCYALKDLYDELGALKAKSTVVFLDACFSGAQRGEGMVVDARGIVQKAKKETPTGNMVVFSAATNDETAYPYKEKNHGLFTYYLLKKLKDSKGNVKLMDLAKYIQDNVSKQSILINRKPQTPTVTASPNISTSWGDWKLRK